MKRLIRAEILFDTNAVRDYYHNLPEDELITEYKEYYDILDDEEVDYEDALWELIEDEEDVYSMDHDLRSVIDEIDDNKIEHLWLIGTVGRWNGTYESINYYNNTSEIMNAIANYNTIKVSSDSSGVHLTLGHHDGEHNFTFYTFKDEDIFKTIDNQLWEEEEMEVSDYVEDWDKIKEWLDKNYIVPLTM